MSTIISTWSDPGPRSANLAGSAFNNLVSGAESAKIQFDNTVGLPAPRSYYATVSIQLGQITTTAGASVAIRVTGRDAVLGSDAGINGDVYPLALAVGTGIKTVLKEMVRLYWGINEISLINNSGTTLATSNNGLWITTWGEQIIEVL